jgi:hypothetical protein
MPEIQFLYILRVFLVFYILANALLVILLAALLKNLYYLFLIFATVSHKAFRLVQVNLVSLHLFGRFFA